MKRFVLTGIYSSWHPGMAQLYMEPGTAPNNWATGIFDGRPINLYRISRMGHELWYPGGYAGYLTRGEERELHNMLYDVSLSCVEKGVAAIRRSIGNPERNFEYLNHVPLDWAEGLWFLDEDKRRVILRGACGWLRDVQAVQAAQQRYEAQWGPVLQEALAPRRWHLRPDLKSAQRRAKRAYKRGSNHGDSTDNEAQRNSSPQRTGQSPSRVCD